MRLLADRTAEALLGMSRALNGLALLVGDRARAVPRDRVARLHVPDWLPPLINAGRVSVTIGAVELFWILTAWPNGAAAIIFAAIVVILFSPKADQAYAVTMTAAIGNSLGAVLAGIIKFAVLPGTETLAGFSLALALVLVPVGALIAQPWQTGLFIGMTLNFIPFLAPANPMTYDTQQFYNSALAIVIGFGAGALSFRLLPPLSPTFRARRLLTLTLRDLRRLATGSSSRGADEWEGRVYSRLSVLPEEAEPAQRAQLVAALSVGTEIIRLRRIADRFGRAPTSMPRSNPWDEAAAASRPSGWPDSTTSLPRCQIACREGRSGFGPAAASLQSRRRLPSIPHISTQGPRGELHRDRSDGRLCCPDLGDHRRGGNDLYPLRRLANHFGLLRRVWHPALFEFAVCIIVLSSIVLLVAR